VWAIVLKEFIQMMRDRVTFGMMVGIPLMQLLLFGFAINSDPKHLPTALRSADQGPFARSFVAALRHQRPTSPSRGSPPPRPRRTVCSNSAKCSS
jgi:ABC-2 type transport system permease protein